MKILVVAELSGSTVRATTLSAITLARRAIELVGGTFSVLVMGADTSAASELRAFGAERVLTCTDPSLANYVAERYAPTVIAAATDFDLVVATASSFGKDLIPRVAGTLDASYAGDCSGLQADGDKLLFKRPMFAGNAFGTVRLTTKVQTATARQSEFEAAQPSGGESPVEPVALAEPTAAASRVEFISLDQVKTERPELSEASRVVSGGRALKERFFDVLEPLADALGAAIGASRAACDAGYAPGDFQVGQTGKIVAPELYIAIGISGAIQHIAGMKGSKTIVAINKDPEAPIFQIADFGLVADLFDAVPSLVTELNKRS